MCMAWTMFFCYFFFTILSSINRFRVSSFYEIIGIDLLMHASITDISIHKFNNDRQDKDKKDEDGKKVEKITDIRIYKKGTPIKPMDTARKFELLKKISRMSTKSIKQTERS